MPLAPRNTTNTAQSATVKPWCTPYQGTRMAAAARVSVNISTLAQTSGACGSVRAGSAMRGPVDSVKDDTITYHAGACGVGTYVGFGGRRALTPLNRACRTVRNRTGAGRRGHGVAFRT